MSETVIWDSEVDYEEPRYRVETPTPTLGNVAPQTWINDFFTDDLDEAIREAERIAYNGGRVRVIDTEGRGR